MPEDPFKQAVSFDNRSIKVGTKYIDKVPEVKVEEPKIKKALDFGILKSMTAGKALNLGGV